MRRLLLLGLVALLLSACGGKSEAGCKYTDDASPTAGRAEEPPTDQLESGKLYRLVVKTNKGSFTIALDQKLAPCTSASLVSLARKRFFDHTVFHRIVPGFVIQGGDPTGSGAGGPGYKSVDPPAPDSKYAYGVVAMAKGPDEPPGAAGSQFFVVTARDVQLPPDYAIVGSVTDGLDVIDRIAVLGDVNEKPTEKVQIEHVTVTVTAA